MDPDDLKGAWKMQDPQGRLTIDADLLLKEVQRNERYFAAMIFMRDVREVGISLLMVPLWIYLGVTMSLPWTWYLVIPGLLWIAGYMLVDRKRQGRRSAGPDEPLRRRVGSLLAQVDHQIWLLRRVLWWYLLPLTLPMLAFFGQIAWRMRSGGWEAVLFASLTIAIVGGVFAGVYWLNQLAVRSDLEPRRHELEALLGSLDEETPSP